ncbi:acetate/propionate family kinase [Azohydromonas caseinilytica]|uniref:Acetate kinase n=1 Tax=Azohydromonas caseinilytica TaxID=2728836 RepID=A0A848FJJ7_9BURK|nr:acetate/propionate family kinase [Azohydromonas caseinilytica]NML18390.1 acetate/propionate family kinase [Azohydromonas caseinilytica]
MGILAVNAGSSTLKFAVYPLRDGVVQSALLSGSFEGLEPQGQLRLGWAKAGGRAQQRELAAGADPFAQALVSLSELLETEGAALRIEAVAHRVVHGGAQYRQSVLVTPQVLKDLQPLCPLAPLHQPHNLDGIRAFMRVLPGLPQVACFDTAFHASLPEVEYSFALPKSLRDEGVRRYGFHGLSYQFIQGELRRLGAHSEGRLVMAHLGNGSSLCAVSEGRSVATTMGFSAVEGLMMGSRCGALDAGVLLYLMEHGWTHDRIQKLLYKESGLLGVSGLTADMRRLRGSDSPEAQLAIDLYTHRVVRETGALTACLGGLDALAFSGGIGEHDVQLRADVAARLAWLGVRIDAQANARATGTEAMAIHASDSAVQLWVVPTDEGRVAAQDAARLVVLPANG